ncbi:HflC protein [hydrothermal vent metagenome]|uniref:HflC protein n=1 Tax=hydrothermal vent metagenome TaxID=652676 RepID=A0A3B0U0U9_9ZZZZ
MNKLTILIVAVLAALYVLFSSVFVVNEREQAIVTRFGEITRVYEKPGLYFKIPTNAIEAVQIIDKRLRRYDLRDITLQVSGGKFYVVDAFVTYKITNPTLFRQNALGSVKLAEQRIATRFDAALRQVYGLRDFNAALSAARSEMMIETRDMLIKDMERLGITVVDVRVLRTDLTSQVSTQTFARMKAERLAEAALNRARGREKAQSIKAIADRKAIVIVAEANRKSEILRGEGDAERNRVFAQAYTLDREFFDFYRSLQAYRTAIGGDGTSMVLSPDSQFFSYFNSDGGATAKQAGAAGKTPVTPLTPPATIPDTNAPEAVAPTPDATPAIAGQ